MKTWLRENPWRSKGFYAWVTSEFQAWVTSASGMREVWFPQREGSSRVAGGDSSAAGVAAGAEPALLTLGVPRAQPVPPSSTSGRAVRVKCLSQEQKYQAPSTSEVGQRGRGERLVHEKLKQSLFLMFLLLQDYLMKNTGLHRALNFSVTITIKKTNSCDLLVNQSESFYSAPFW